MRMRLTLWTLVLTSALLLSLVPTTLVVAQPEQQAAASTAAAGDMSSTGPYSGPDFAPGY